MHAQTKTKVYIDNTCIECYNSFSSAPSLLRHMQFIHGISLFTRQPNIRRPSSDQYVYERTNPPPSTCLIHHGCPSCWEHTEDIAQLREHILTEHLDTSVQEYEEGRRAHEERHQRRSYTASTATSYNDPSRLPSSTAAQSSATIVNNQEKLLAMVEELANSFRRLFSTSTTTSTTTTASSSNSSSANNNPNVGTASRVNARFDEDDSDAEDTTGSVRTNDSNSLQ